MLLVWSLWCACACCFIKSKWWLHPVQNAITFIISGEAYFTQLYHNKIIISALFLTVISILCYIEHSLHFPSACSTLLLPDPLYKLLCSSWGSGRDKTTPRCYKCSVKYFTWIVNWKSNFVMSGCDQRFLTDILCI